MKKKFLSIAFIVLLVVSGAAPTLARNGFEENLDVGFREEINKGDIESPMAKEHAVIVQSLDQFQGTVDQNGQMVQGTAVVGQEFIPTMDNLSRIDIYVMKKGSPGDIIVEVMDSTGTNRIAISGLSEASVPLAGWITINFSNLTPPALTPGETYRIYVYSGNSPNADNYYAWLGADQSEYCSRCMNYLSGVYPEFDFSFRTYGMGIKPDTNADFDRDNKTEISVYRPSNGKWYIQGQPPTWWGLPGDIPVPGDYDGDNEMDLAVYRPSNGKWYLKDISTTWWGLAGDVPVQADYDGNGYTDLAVYRPSNGKWYINGESPVWWGFPDDIPVPGDYDGDGSAEIAVFRPSNGNWYIYGESPVWWGLNGDIPVPADYDGDGATDLAVYRPSNGKWYIKGNSPVWWGMSGDIPIPGDYDGCGDAEIAVLRPSNGNWFVKDQSKTWYYLPDDYPLPVRDTNADGDPYH